MKKVIIILSFLLSATLSFAQKDDSAYSIKKLRHQIGVRDSVLQKDMKPRVLIDSLRSQIADYDSLTKSMERRYQDIAEVVKTYELLMSPDTLVFIETFSQYDVPQCLKSHVLLIEKISQLRNDIENVEHKVQDLTNRLNGLNVNVKSVIHKEIEHDVLKLDAVITEIERMDLSTLSDKQKQFFKPGLTERYNEFLIYFE